MTVEKFDIIFKLHGREQEAHIEKFQIGKYPQLWVSCKQYYFTFYDMGNRLFWYDLPDERQYIARSIAKALGHVALPNDAI